MAQDINDIVARSNAVLSMGTMMHDAALHDSEFKIFFVVVKGGPDSRTAAICTGAASILNLTWDIVDGLKDLGARDRPFLLQPLFHHDPTEFDMRNLAQSAIAKAPGSLIVVAIRGTETDVQDARNTLAEIDGVLATCCFA